MREGYDGEESAVRPAHAPPRPHLRRVCPAERGLGPASRLEATMRSQDEIGTTAGRPEQTYWSISGRFPSQKKVSPRAERGIARWPEVDEFGVICASIRMTRERRDSRSVARPRSVAPSRCRLRHD